MNNHNSNININTNTVLMWIGQTGLTSSGLQKWCLVTSSNAKTTHRFSNNVHLLTEPKG